MQNFLLRSSPSQVNSKKKTSEQKYMAQKWFYRRISRKTVKFSLFFLSFSVNDQRKQRSECVGVCVCVCMYIVQKKFLYFIQKQISFNLIEHIEQDPITGSDKQSRMYLKRSRVKHHRWGTTGQVFSHLTTTACVTAAPGSHLCTLKQTRPAWR